MGGGRCEREDDTCVCGGGVVGYEEAPGAEGVWGG